MRSILIISVAKPILVGIYENETLLKSIEKDGMTSDVLPIIIKDILSKYSIDEIIYINGPGSYMAIKIAYIFLKTISITQNISLKAIDGFCVNNNSPIKALGKKYFIKQNDTIKIDFISDSTKIKPFFLPPSLKNLEFSNDTLPQYHLPAV